MLIDYTTGKIVRPGSINRIPNYVPNYDNKADRKWEFQSPKSPIRSINNITHLRHFKTPSSKEFQKFHKIKNFPQPDSKRTIISRLLPENPIKKKSPIRRVTESKKEYTFHKKRASENIYNNNLSLYLSNNNKYLNTSSSTQRRLKKVGPLYTKYHNTSQILLLPGGIKRKEENINDDYDKFKKEQQLVKKNPNKYKYNNNFNRLRKEKTQYNIKSNNYNTFNNINSIPNIKKLRKNKIINKKKISKIKRNNKISINDN